MHEIWPYDNKQPNKSVDLRTQILQNVSKSVRIKAIDWAEKILFQEE